MDIKPLYELKDRLRAASIAGTNLLSEDFRLKKAAEGFKALENVSPVFKKISDLTAELLSEKCEDKSGVLLDTVTLVDSVICTLGATEAAGEFSDIPAGKSDGSVNEIPYSKLNAIIEALTSSGSGKMEIVQTAWEETPELFRDFRMIPALVKGLGASYAELADYVQTIIGELGADMLPLLKKGFDPKGKKETVRRVRAIEAIEAANGLNESAFYIEQLDNAEKDVRTALVYALRHNEENIDKLIELTKTEKGKAKTAAFTALVMFDNEKAAAFFEEYSKKKPVEVLEYLKKAWSKWACKLTAELIEKSLVDKDSNKITYSQLTRDNLRLKNGANRWTFQSALYGKTGAEIEKIYREFDDAEFAPNLSLRLGEAIAVTGDESLKKLAVELNTKSPMKGRFVYAEGVVHLISDKDCTKWLRDQIKTVYESLDDNKNAISNSEITQLLRMIVFENGKFSLQNRYYDDISDGWIFDSPIPLDQPITGAVADVLMEFPCWSFDRLLETWYSYSNNDEDFRKRLSDCFTKRVLSPEGDLGIMYYLRLLGADRQKGLIRGYCETHCLDLGDMEKVIMWIGGDDNNYHLTETRELIELIKQGRIKTRLSEEDLRLLAEWNEKRHGGA